MNKVQEALKAAIEALEMAAEDAKEWAMQYVTSDNAPITVRQYVADKAEPALNQLKSALSEIDKCEPVALADENIVSTISIEMIKELETRSGNKFPYHLWPTKLYTSPQPIEKCESETSLQPVAYLYETPSIAEGWTTRTLSVALEKNLPPDTTVTPLYTSPISKEWVVLSNEVIDTLWHKATQESVAHNEPFTRYRFTELLLKKT